MQKKLNKFIAIVKYLHFSNKDYKNSAGFRHRDLTGLKSVYLN